MQIDLSRFREAFFDEAVEHQHELEAGLLQLEIDHDDSEALNSVFRAAHSIKGSSGVFDLPDITRYTHALESLLDQMRKHAVAITAELIELLLRAADVLQDLIVRSRSGAQPPAQVASSIAELDAACAHSNPERADSRADGAPTACIAAPSVPRMVRLTIAPKPRLFQRGSDPLLLLRELAQLGRVLEVRAELAGLPGLSQLDPELCYLSWNVRIESEASLERLREVFVFVEDECDVAIDEPLAAVAAAMPAAPEDVLEDATNDRRSGGDRRTVESNSLRVSIDKVDHLIDLVGELVIAQSMVNQVMASFAPERMPQLREAVSGMQRNMRELQEQVMSVRMVTMGTVFSRFPRLVRDLAASTGKNVVLEVAGEETELDKGMVERIADPLMHLVRNCVDHGLETPDERRLAGKPEQGVVRIRAMHEGGNVVVEVADDGRGLDLQRVVRKAVALGLVPDGAELNDAEATALIFRAGFSTADQVNDISGRGVGMDVVKRNVEALGGSVSIESRRGSGTCFRIKLPLTLAILDGLLMAVGAQTFILPLLAVVESIQLGARDVRVIHGQGELALVRGDPLPLLRLANLLGVRDARSDVTRGIAVVLEHAGQRVALLVDELIGQSQVVIKNLEANFGRIEGVMGATILGDGAVALILDTQGLIRLAARKSQSASQTGGPELECAASRELQEAQA